MQFKDLLYYDKFNKKCRNLFVAKKKYKVSFHVTLDKILVCADS